MWGKRSFWVCMYMRVNVFKCFVLFEVFNIACKWLFNRVAGYNVTLEHQNTNTLKLKRIACVHIRVHVIMFMANAIFRFMSGCERERLVFVLLFFFFAHSFH